MQYYQNNAVTKLAVDAFTYFEFYCIDLPGREYIESLNTVTTFYDYTYTHAEKNGFDADKLDADAIAKFIIKLGEERNAPLSSLNTEKYWFKKATPAANLARRENVYTLCFSLGLKDNKNMGV